MSTRIPQHFIDDLLTRIDIVELIDSYVPLRKKGSSYSACCPFHSEKTPSFHVTSAKQLYHCFGCGAGGNAISFVMAHENLDFIETLKLLAARAGVELPKTNFLAQESSESPALYPVLEEATNYFQQALKQHQPAIDYLKSRGISGQIAKTFRIGYASNQWDKLYKHFSAKDQKNELLSAGLIIKKETSGFYDRFRDRIIFPIRDIQGRVIAFGGRILTQGEPKYLNSPETALFQKGKELYGLYEARKASHSLENIWIVEGYLDLIALVQAGIPNAVATLGTAVTASHLQRLFRFTSEIIFCFDGDKAGQQAAWRALEVLLPFMQDDYRARFVMLPQGEDPDTYVRKLGRDKFLAMEAQSLPEFFFATMVKQIDISLPEGKAKLAKQATEHLKKIPGKFLQQIMLDRLSHLVRIDVDRLGSLTQMRSTISPPRHHLRFGKQRLTKHSPVRMAMMLLLQYPHLGLQIELPNELNTLSVPGVPLLLELYQLLKNHPDLSAGILIEHWRGREEEAVIQKLATQAHWVPEEGVMQELKGAFLQLQALCREQKIDWLLQQGQIRTLTSEEKELLNQLIHEKMKQRSS